MALFAFGNSTIEIADAVNRADEAPAAGAIFDSATRTITTAYQERPQAPRQEIGITILVECAAVRSHSASSIQFVLDTLQAALAQRATGSLRQHLRNALHYAHEQMLHAGSLHDGADIAQMSVTLAAIVEDRLYISRTGAQRAYLFDGRDMQSITPEPATGTSGDVSYLGAAGSLRIVDRILSPAADTGQETVNTADADYLILKPESVVLICSDAISKVMSPHVMGTIVAESLAGYSPPNAAMEDGEGAGDLLEAARRLTAWAETGCAAVLFRWQRSSEPASTPNKWPKTTPVLIVVLLILSVISLSFTLRQIWTLYWGDTIAAQSEISLDDLSLLAATATALIAETQIESSIPSEPTLSAPSDSITLAGAEESVAAITVVSIAAEPALITATVGVTTPLSRNGALVISGTVTSQVAIAETPTFAPTATPHLAQTATAWKQQQETRASAPAFSIPVLPPTTESASTNTPAPTPILNGLATPNLSQTAAARALVLATNIAATRTAEPTATVRPSATSTLTNSPTATETSKPARTSTSTSTPTSTSTSIPTRTSTPTVTFTPPATATPTATPAPTNTATATATSTATFTSTPLPTSTATFTSSPTATDTATAAPTSTATAALTLAPNLIGAAVLQGVAQVAEQATRAAATETAAIMPTPSNTSTATSTATLAPPSTPTPTHTPTTAPSLAPARIGAAVWQGYTQLAERATRAAATTTMAQATPTFTRAATSTFTPTATATHTSIPTSTPTLPMTPTGTPTLTPTATSTFTATATATPATILPPRPIPTATKDEWQNPSDDAIYLYRPFQNIKYPAWPAS